MTYPITQPQRDPEAEYTVERWYNRQERAWVVSVSEDGFEISSDYISVYGGGKQIAIEHERDLRSKYGIEEG